MANDEFSLTCPTPLDRNATVQLAHGGGGRKMRDLIERAFLPAFGSKAAAVRHDSSIVTLDGVRVAFTTDSFVVHPLFFPGGDIGTLAVYGTVNDLAMAGAMPQFISAGFIIEEGFAMEDLCRVVESMHRAAAACGVEIVTGDTKVVDRGKGDGLFINTSGIGVVPDGVDISPPRVHPDDAILISGDVGRHGIAVMSVREGLEFESAIESDCAPLDGSVRALLEAGIDVHCLRDLTRGGLASALNEIAMDGHVGVEIDEEVVQVNDAVAGACEILGLDPLYVANEGRFVAFVPAGDTERALAALRSHPISSNAQRIGRVTDSGAGKVILNGRLGAKRLLDLLSGEQLPRIC